MPTSTRAIASAHPGPVDEDSFVDIEFEVGDPGPHDLLVEVRAVSVNPVDTKVRASFDPAEAPKVLGWDAAGVVLAIGSDVASFAVGDEVYYAGSIARPGSDAGVQLVDERITGHKPHSLDFAQAAALPLTTITAWEVLFDLLEIREQGTGTLLVLGGAGGVGSMVTQLARARTGLTVIATASRPDSEKWCRDMGAHFVVDHHDLVANVRAVAPDGLDYVFSSFSAGNVEAFAELLNVHGKIAAIDDPETLDVVPLKPKALSWHWEFMFARPQYAPEDTYQRELLDEAARLIDAGTVRTTLTTKLTPINAANLRDAHRQVETSSTIGKVVVSSD